MGTLLSKIGATVIFIDIVLFIVCYIKLDILNPKTQRIQGLVVVWIFVITIITFVLSIIAIGLGILLKMWGI